VTRHARIEPSLELPELSEWIEEEVGHLFVRQRERKLGYVRYLLDAAFFRRLPHKNPIRYGSLKTSSLHDQFFEASAFNSRDLADQLGDSYRAALTRFFDFAPENEGYSREYKTTKAYHLNERTLAKLIDVWRNSSSSRVINKVNGEVLTVDDLPDNGVLRPRKIGIHVPSLIPLSSDHIDRLIQWEESEGDASGRNVPTHRRPRFVRRLRALYRARHYARLLGGIPNLYVDTREADWRTDGDGRLSALGDFNLQGSPRDLRPLLLKGSGWTDWDFKACHPTIFVALATAYGVPTPTWQDCLANRKTRIAELGEATDIRPKKLKRIILALLYGQPLSASPKGQLRDLIGKDGVAKLKENSYFAALKTEIREARLVIIARHQQGYQIKNAVGKLRATRKPSTDEGTQKSRRKPKRMPVQPRKLLSHILTGYEAWALRTVVANTQGVKVLIHDGFITGTEADIDEQEEHLDAQSKETWGFPLQLKLEGSTPF
jgi:hypothetical protein